MSVSNQCHVAQNLNDNSFYVLGIIKDGGTKASVIPATAKMEFILRAPDEEQLNQVSERVRSCLHSAAQATGCSVDVTTIAAVKNLVPNRNLTKIYESFAEIFGELCFGVN